MYIPSHFRESDERVLAEFIDAYSFGTLVTVEGALPFASHLPFLHDREGRTLHAHVARGNPQWQHIAANADVLVMFQGPHGYVSPTWYAEPGVPTWNYTAVHVYGRARVLDDAAATGRHVEKLAARFERGSAAPWVPDYDARTPRGDRRHRDRDRRDPGQVQAEPEPLRRGPHASRSAARGGRHGRVHGPCEARCRRALVLLMR